MHTKTEVVEITEAIEALDQLAVKCERIRHELNVMEQRLDEEDRRDNRKGFLERLFTKEKK